jgi:two-component system osmolarity sensor histidine kinase EnvZ
VSETLIKDLDASVDATQAPSAQNRSVREFPGMSLFWRTFILLAILLLGSILAWLQTLRSLELEPRAVQTAQQLASLVNLSRAALIHADAIGRLSLIKTLAQEEGLRIVPKETNDRFVALESDALNRDIATELRERLGRATVLASQVNEQTGLWIGFEMDGDDYWLLADLNRYKPSNGKTWVIWLVVAALLSLAGAALIAGLGMPTRLRDQGVSRDQFEAIARGAMDNMWVRSNPRPITSQQDVIGLLEAAF